MQLKAAALYQFGPYLLHTGQHLLTRQGIPVALTPKTYDLLLALVVNHERIMLKDELIKTVWPDAFVEESNLTQQVSAVRKALGERRRGPLHCDGSRKGISLRGGGEI